MLGAETMGAAGVPEDFGRFIQAEKMGRRRARR